MFSDFLATVFARFFVKFFLLMLLSDAHFQFGTSCLRRCVANLDSVGAWSDQEFNVLCLCPNCHALMKYGGRDLNKIFVKAEKVARGDEAPEEVGERRGDFYIVQITIADKRDEIFYTPFHMAKISAFIEWLKTYKNGN